jgi:hypothetical protein
LSTLQKKIILVDENLSKIIGIGHGELTSYAELTKGIHEYIKKYDLRKKTELASESPSGNIRFCFNCGADMSASSIFCDKCGKKQ